MVLASHGFAISHHFPGVDSRSTHLIDSEFTTCIIIKALDQGDVEPFSLGFHEITIEQLDDTSDVLGAFVGGEMDDEFEELFVGVFLECNLLVEDELVVARG